MAAGRKRNAAPATTGDTLVVGVWQDGDSVELTPGAKDAQSANAVFARLVEADELKAGAGEATVIHYPEGLGYRRLVVVGLGAAGRLTWGRLEKAVRAAVKAAQAEDMDWSVEGWAVEGAATADVLRFIARTVWCEGAPAFTLKSKVSTPKVLQGLGFIGADEDLAAAAVAAARLEAGAVRWAQELAETPSNLLTPEGLGEAARQLAQENSALRVHEWDLEEIRAKPMSGLMAVGFGSDNLPTFVELSYHGGGRSAPVVLVGKGVTFDAGGISLKPARGMDEMKFDMTGAAVVLAAVKYAADMKLPINVTALVPACENLPSGCAVKPGDVIEYGNGTTVEILNTDAEGRLILADALIRAGELKPAVVVDVATLTGACIVALGSEASGLFTEDADLRDELLAAATASGDAAWPMPLNEAYRDLVKSGVADLANIGPAGSAGACTAAAFLSAFAPSVPWAHLDVAGSANTHGECKRATGRPLPLLMTWLNERACGATTVGEVPCRAKRGGK